jgi:hypothetical protein
MILAISTILITLAIILLPVLGILSLKIHHLMFEDYLNPSFKYYSSWRFIKRSLLSQNKKELLNDFKLLNKIKSYNILVITFYFCFIIGLLLFFFNIIQNNNQ